MENKEKLSIYFYIYAGVEILLTFIGANLLTRGINIILLIIVFQILGQVAITIEGHKNDRYDAYRLYLGAVVPFIMLSMMLWLNTF